MTNNKTANENHLDRIYWKDVFGFAEHQEVAKFSLRCKLTLQGNSDIQLLGHRTGTDAENDALAGKVSIEVFGCHVPKYTANRSQQS